jgi:hypothetical protein
VSPFEQIWESSRTNSWSWGYPTVLTISIVILIALSLVPQPTLRHVAKVLVILACGFATIKLSAREIEEKWSIRWDWAQRHENTLSDAEREALTADGANRALGPFLIGMQTVVWLTALCGVLYVIRKIVNWFGSRRSILDVPDVESPSPTDR